MLSSGHLLDNRYRLDERIATGGMGDVWRGTDMVLGRIIAVKVLRAAMLSDPEFAARFYGEARMMAAFRHPGVVEVYDYASASDTGGEDQVAYLVMAYVDGEPLSARLKEQGRLPIEETMSIVAQAADALHAAHQNGTVHRDVKPGNLIVKPNGTVILVDFGVARSTESTGLTATNMVLGTADYMAPEQAIGRPVSAATDIYALGAVAYCCLAGRPPFTGDNPLQVVSQHLQSEPPTLPAWEIPASVAALVSRALAKEPADRYPSAAAFAGAARVAQTGSPADGALRGGPPAAYPRSAQTGPPTDNAQRGGPAASAGGARNGPATGPMRNRPSAAEPAAEQPLYFPPKAPGGNRRRNSTLVGVAAAVVIGLVALIGFMAFRSGPAQSQGRPTQRAGDDIRNLGGGPGSGPGSQVVVPPNGGPIPPVQSATPSKKAGQTARPSTSATTPPAAATTAAGTPKPTTTTATASTSNPYTPGQVCGSGYQIIDSATLTATGGTVATVYLLYNSSSGSNCTTTLKTTEVGSKTAVTAYLEVQGRSRSTDSGSFSYYAGPVRAKAAAVCVKWGGSAGGASYDSPFEHCD